MKCKHNLIIVLTLLLICSTITSAYANDTDLWKHYGKQQIKTKDSKGNTIYNTPNYNSYADRNSEVSEKIVAIYDKHSPAYGYRYVLYTPIGHYVGHHRVVQQSMNGYYEPIPDGDITGVSSKTPCFKSISEAKHYYYPQWY